MTEKDYAKGKKNGHRRWDFKDKAWELEKYFWRANRLLVLLKPERYYSTMYFWNGSNNEFLCYYINFQSPFQRTHCGINTLDLELDLIINADLSYEWKDLDDFQKATEHGIIYPEWIQGIENAKPEIFDQLERRRYPFDGSWLDWRPDPHWSAPTLPKIGIRYEVVDVIASPDGAKQSSRIRSMLGSRRLLCSPRSVSLAMT